MKSLAILPSKKGTGPTGRADTRTACFPGFGVENKTPPSTSGVAKTQNLRHLGASDRGTLIGHAYSRWLAGFDASDLPARPKTRGECQGGMRPCPWLLCRYHLALDVDETNGSIKFNFPRHPGEQVDADDVRETDIDSMPETCALDVADRVGSIAVQVAGYDPGKDERLSLGELASLLNLSYDRAYQVFVEAVGHLQRNERRRKRQEEDGI